MTTKSIILAGWLVLMAGGGRADVIVSQTFSPDGEIPEGSPIGMVFAGDFNAAGSAGDAVKSVTVALNITGGYNGDLYAYLVAPNGTMVMLMDKPGTQVDTFGAESSGMNNVILSDAGGSSIQNVTGGAGTVLTGTYTAEGALGTFNNSPAQGTWDIYFADLGSGAGAPVLDDWTLAVEVPEPVNVALGIFSVSWLSVRAWHWQRRRGGEAAESATSARS